MKTLLISHIADADGISPIILLNLVLEDFDYKLFEISDVEPFMQKFIDNELYKNYDQVYITDLSLTLNICKQIDNIPELKEKLLVFDHHQSNLFVNDYDFATVVVKNEEGRMECGTSLFYKYLKATFPDSLINNQVVSEYVELVREGDTWDFLNDYEEKARDFGLLFSLYTRERFINNFTDILKNNSSDLFSEREIYLLSIEKERMQSYIDNKLKQVYFAKIDNYRVGVVFAENYRSVLGNYLSKYFEDKIDFVIIINMSRSISYRTIKDINVGEFAKVYGGSGHKKAAGSPLPSQLREQVMKLIYKEMVIENES